MTLDSTSFRAELRAERAAAYASRCMSLSGDRALIYRGLVRGEAFRCEGSGDVFAKIDQGRVGEVHKELGQEGIDAYCPACDRVYCDQHYRLQTEYDDGFYDCTRATCPAGHQRMVDD